MIYKINITTQHNINYTFKFCRSLLSYFIDTSLRISNKLSLSEERPEIARWTYRLSHDDMPHKLHSYTLQNITAQAQDQTFKERQT